MSERDVSEAFNKQLREMRPYGIAFVVVIVGMFAGLAFVASTGSRDDLIWVGLPAVLLMVPLGLPIFRAHRCPNCRRFMGRDVGRFCPLCSARLRRD